MGFPMAMDSKTHEELIKFIYLIDKWRSRSPKEKEILALSTVGSKKYPEQVKKSINIAQSLQIPSYFPTLEKINRPIQNITVALTLLFLFVLVSYLSRSFAWELAEELLFNPLFAFSAFSSFVVTGLIMYEYRIKRKEYNRINYKYLQEFKPIVEELIVQLAPLAIDRSFQPNKYPFRLNYNDYSGLRYIGRSGSISHLMFSLPHCLMIKSTDTKIMTQMGRLAFYDGLTGFRGGKPTIKIIVSQIAGDFKTYLKKCADWRQQGIDVLVRKAKENQITRSYLIIDNQHVWVSNLLLEEFDSSESVDLNKIKDKDEKRKIINRFNKLWEASQKAEELEALSWRTYFKERAENERKRKPE
jgi:hypothetical protein